MQARLSLRDELMLAAGDLLHAGTVVAFADSCAGWGCLASLPEHAFVIGHFRCTQYLLSAQR